MCRIASAIIKFCQINHSSLVIIPTIFSMNFLKISSFFLHCLQRPSSLGQAGLSLNFQRENTKFTFRATLSREVCHACAKLHVGCLCHAIHGLCPILVLLSKFVNISEQVPSICPKKAGKRPLVVVINNQGRNNGGFTSLPSRSFNVSNRFRLLNPV